MLEQRITDLFPGEKNELLDLFHLPLIEEYYSFLLEKNEAGGFFSKNETPLILDRHVLESLYHVYRIGKFKSVSRETKICDAGSGPGLPGFLFTSLKEYPQVTLLDSQMRKLSHLEGFVKLKSLQRNLSFLYARIEDVKKKYDIVVMRSTIPYPWSIEVCSGIVAEGGYFVPFLGKKTVHLELEKKFLNHFQFEIEEENIFPSLNFLGERSVKFLKKKENRKDSSSRPWSVIQKEIRKFHG